MSHPLLYSLTSDKVMTAAGDLLADIAATGEPTLYLLSGGSAIASYGSLIKRLQAHKEQKIAFGLVDERFGPVGHEHSNAAAIEREVKLKHVCRQQDWEYGNILTGNNDLLDTATRYQAWLLSMFGQYTHRVAVLGIGSDGHTAGIMPALEEEFKETFDDRYVAGYSSTHAHKDRITLTPQALLMCTHLVVVAVGDEKRSILHRVLNEQPEPPLYQLPAVLIRHHLHASVFTDNRYE